MSAIFLSASAASGTNSTIRFTIGTSSSSSTTSIPANAQVNRVDVTVTTPYSSGATIQIGQTGSTSLLAAAADVNAQDTSTAQQTKIQDTSWGSSALAVLATVSGSPGAGAARVTVYYSSPVNA